MSIEMILGKIDKQLRAGIYPGASLALYRDGQWLDFYFGLADPSRKEGTRSGLVYDLASVSKVVGVGTVAAFLLHSSSLELDRPLRHYYPAFHDNQVTVRQLLTHTSGLDPYIPHRNELNAQELKAALNRLTVLEDRSFRYTDVNFLLLGFMLEEMFDKSLDALFQQEIFEPWQLSETGFGPVKEAVPTVRGVEGGLVHDPKARVLGIHAGSAGLFSTVKDLKRFLEHYLQDEFASELTQNFSREAGKARSLGWNIDGNWLDHTGYTGTFIMYNRIEQKAVIFLSNRTYEKDERAQWILDRNQLMDLIKKEL